MHVCIIIVFSLVDLQIKNTNTGTKNDYSIYKISKIKPEPQKLIYRHKILSLSVTLDLQFCRNSVFEIFAFSIIKFVPVVQSSCVYVSSSSHVIYVLLIKGVTEVASEMYGHRFQLPSNNIALLYISTLENVGGPDPFKCYNTKGYFSLFFMQVEYLPLLTVLSSHNTSPCFISLSTRNSKVFHVDQRNAKWIYRK